MLFRLYFLSDKRYCKGLNIPTRNTLLYLSLKSQADVVDVGVGVRVWVQGGGGVDLRGVRFDPSSSGSTGLVT